MDNKINKPVVCRIAPSPTGYGLHCGNIRTLLFNYLFAKQNGGTFYLRIEDTDQKRFIPESEALIKKTLDWLGIVPDFAPWTEYQPYGSMRQSERDYTQYATYLLDKGYAYYAFDTEDELQAIRFEHEARKANFSYSHSNRMSMRNSLSLPADVVSNLLATHHPYTIRFKVIPDVDIKFTDIVRGELHFNSSEMDDKVLVKTNGIPTYHLANICDDHNMGTTHTIRGEEWVSSTPLHIMLYNAFGWDYPQFAHLPSVLNPPPLPGKLSKRNAVKLGIPIFPFGGPGEDDKGNKFVLKGLVDEGYDSEAFVNFLLLLGWTHPEGHEIISIQDGIEKFDLHNVHKAGARYDIEKLKFFNGWYLQNKTSDEELLKYVNFGDDLLTGFSQENKLAILDMAKKRSHFKIDMQKVVDIFINPVVLNDSQKASITDLHQEIFNTFIEKIWYSEQWDADYIKQTIFDSCEKHGFKMNKLMPIVRTVLAGGITGPDMISFMVIIGKQQTIRRIRRTQLLISFGNH